MKNMSYVFYLLRRERKTVVNIKIKNIIIHILVWGVILSINLSLFGNYFGHDYDMYKIFFLINAPVWAAYLILFYVNYLIFIPKLLFSNSISSYVFCAIVTISLCYVAIQEYKASGAATKMQQEFPAFASMKNYGSGNSSNSKQNQSQHIQRANNNKQDSISRHNYVQTPILTQTKVQSRNVSFRPRKQNSIIIDESISKDEPKVRLYGDMLYYYNEKDGIRTVSPPHKRNVYNLRDPRNITQVYLIMLIFAVALVLGAIEKSIQRSRDVERIYHEKMTSELSYLKQQINPHFLFNALNSIYSLVLPHSEPASDAVIKLSSILRYMLYETDKAQVSLEKEVEVIKDYISLQKFKFTDITKVNFNVEGQLIGHTIEPLLLIPFIENAFKYGADNITPSHINIDLKIDKEYFIMQVTNRVVVSQKNVASSGIGIKNIRRRLDLLYPDRHSLDISQANNLFSVKLKIKLL